MDSFKVEKLKETVHVVTDEHPLQQRATGYALSQFSPS